jgi:hypothetical protein
LRTGEGDSSDDEAGGENVNEENDGLNEQAPKKKSSKKPKNKAAATRPSNHDLKISWAIEVMLHAHVTKMQEREAEEMNQLPDDAEDKSSPKKGKKRAYDPPAKSEELADSSLHGPSKKMRQKSEGKELWIGGEIVDRLLVFGMRSSGRSLIFGSAFFWFQGVW